MASATRPDSPSFSHNLLLYGELIASTDVNLRGYAERCQPSHLPKHTLCTVPKLVTCAVTWSFPGTRDQAMIAGTRDGVGASQSVSPRQHDHVPPTPTTLPSLVGFVPILWSTAGLVLFTFSAQRPRCGIGACERCACGDRDLRCAGGDVRTDHAPGEHRRTTSRTEGVMSTERGPKSVRSWPPARSTLCEQDVSDGMVGMPLIGMPLDRLYRTCVPGQQSVHPCAANG
jgi:hypothetical protein